MITKKLPLLAVILLIATTGTVISQIDPSLLTNEVDANPRGIGFGSCWDRSTSCFWYLDQCSDERVQKFCQESCNLCDTTGAECEDSAGAAYCSTFKVYCDFDSISQQCQKTCEICKDNGGSSGGNGKQGEWGEFSEWGECSEECGGGTEVRTRTCITRPCKGEAREERECNTDPCEVQCEDLFPCGAYTNFCYLGWVKSSCPKTCNDCPKPKKGWGPFGKWGDCSQKCGGGTQTRTRECIKEPCPGNPSEERSCNMQKCSVWLDWSDYNECTVTCGGGTKYRTRMCDGSDCDGDSREEVECNMEQCPPGYDDWEDWGRCSERCDGGVQTRTRVCNRPPCDGHDTETQLCNEKKCKLDCKDNWSTCQFFIRNCGQSNIRRNCPNTCGTCKSAFSDWSEFGPCAEDCGISTKTRTRSCNGRGNSCKGVKEQIITCIQDPCVDTGYGPWSPYGDCSKTCGVGTKTRTRVCERPPCTQEPSETVDCIDMECPSSKWQSWSRFGDCSKNCGGGTRTRTRTCNQPPGAPPCVGEPTDSEDCNMRSCPEPYWSRWGRWGDCDADCGPSTRTRTRVCERPRNTPEDAECPGSPTQSQDCNLDACPGPYYKKWGAWEPCSANCDGGTQSRNRECVIPQGNPPTSQCNGLPSEERDCNVQRCPYYSEWGEFEKCSKTCGGGLSQSRRTCIIPQGTPQGVNCPPATLTREQTCNEQQCPFYGEWGVWSACDAECGDGTRTRNRECKFGTPGQCNGPSEETVVCSAKPCPEPQWSNWRVEGDCTKLCGGGRQKYVRTCSKPPLSVGDCAGSATKYENCNVDKCVAPKWGDWQKEGECTKLCGTGDQRFTRTCILGTDPAENCRGSSVKTESCNTHRCPNPFWNEWEVVEECSKPCGPGIKSFKRVCEIPPGASGTCSGKDTKTEDCNIRKCKAPEWEEWAKDGECSKTCGSIGMQKYFRVCKPGEDPTEQCSGQSTKTEPCNRFDCPMPTWKAWEITEDCSKPCGEGIRSFKRECEIPDGATGTCVGQPTKTEKCNLRKCKAPEWEEWAKDGECSKTCGSTGMQKYIRECKPGEDPTEQCSGQSTKTEPCNRIDCPEYTQWKEGQCSASCGGGTKTSSRKCMFKNAEVSSDQCVGPETKEENCNVMDCPSFGNWGTYGKCFMKEGSCVKERKRDCRFNGKVVSSNLCIGSDSNSVDCDEDSCTGGFPPYRDFGPGECSDTCGTGTTYTQRTDSQGSYRHYTECNTASCPYIPCPAGYQRRKNDTKNGCCKVDNSETCGTLTKTGFVSRVLGGVDSKEGEIPWQVFFITRNHLRQVNLCGGTIITPIWVVTAAHCIVSDGKDIQPEDIGLIAGEIHITTKMLLNAPKNVRAAYPHDQYDYPKNDVGMIKMKNSFIWSTKIRPACLPNGEFPPQDSSCLVSGFGISDNAVKQYTPDLQIARVEILHNEICLNGYRSASVKKERDYMTNDPDKVICAGSIESNFDSCSGDSGGPLVCQRRGSCNFYLAGIVSFGPNPCAQARSPGVYSAVKYFEDWINNIMTNNS